MRKHNLDTINLQIDDFIPYANERYVGFVIKWSSKIGFGEYTIYKEKDSDKWMADSECMDKNEDKSFINKLMELFIKKISIT